MAIVLPFPLTIQEMRVLQEFRRIGTETMSLAAIKAIKHPVGLSPDAAVAALTSKGYLVADETGQSMALTEPAREFLAIDARPEEETVASSADEPAE